MGQVLHGCARTTEAVRRAIQHSQESLRALARRHGVNPKTIAKWRARADVADRRTGPAEPRSTTLSAEEEAIVVAFRRHRLKRVADSREYPWLRIMEEGLHFVFLIDQVPVRFYRGPANEPTARVPRRHETEAQQLQLALGLEGGDGLAFRIALETNDRGAIERAVFLVLRGDEGQAECAWPIPLASTAETSPSHGAQLRLIADDGYQSPSGGALIRPGAAARRRATAARRLAG